MNQRPTAIAAVAIAFLAGAGAIAAAAGDPPTAIDACRNLRHGLVRIVFDPNACKSNEAYLALGAEGVPGPAGPVGPAGPPGPQGEPGASLTAVDALAGSACTTFDGAAGSVEIGSTATDLITFTCEPGGSPPPPPPPPPGAVRLVINEVDYDQVGADTGGFVEIANTGSADAVLDGIALVLVNGGDNTEYDRESLTGTLAAGAKLVVSVDPQNGAPDGLALLDTGANVLLDALSYEGAITAATIGTGSFNLVEGTMLPVDVADSNTVEGSLIRSPDETDSDNAASDWAFTTTPTPGAANVKTP